MLYDSPHGYEARETLVEDADDMNAELEEDEYASSKERTVQEIWRQPPMRVIYEYDLRDGWEHSIEFEGEVNNGQEAVVLEGSGRPAVEDCGGPYGWKDYKVSEYT